MDLDPNFAFTPLQNAAAAPPVAPPDPTPVDGLVGTWKGPGFNAIWRPLNGPQDRFLELNATQETLEVTAIPGTIPNRGLLQADLLMTGVRYLQQIVDANQKDEAGAPAGLHIEPGLWLAVPATEDPSVPRSVARLASIPHGTTIVAQGSGFQVDGGPRIDPVSLDPFPIGNFAGAFRFPEQDLATPTDFRTPDQFLTGITQAMVDDPNSVLTAAIGGQTITRTTVLSVTTESTPILGGGTANTAFLEGSSHGPNADAAEVTSIFWIEQVDGGPMQLQYTQTVLLNFAGLSWPHVTVGTLVKQ